MVNLRVSPNLVANRNLPRALFYLKLDHEVEPTEFRSVVVSISS